tara:strand:- start:857 stop:1051 length:195 start_codon:yes stop_codon:yes gene_type:complete
MLTEKEKQAVYEFVDKLIDNDLIDARLIPRSEEQFFEWWKVVKSEQEIWEQMLLYRHRDEIPQA